MIPFSKYSPRVGIRNSTDYSPFGVELEGRTVSIDGYRFGYQGSEKDNEFKGDGNSYATEFRQLDPRLGRWLSLDPVIQPWQSPYCSMDNNPIFNYDRNGKKVIKEKTVGVTNKEFRKFKQVIRQMRRASESFNKMYKELDESEEIYKLTAAPNFKPGAAGEYIPKDKTGDGTNHILIDIKNKEYISIIGHEVGHAFRQKFGLDFAPKKIELPTRPSFVLTYNKQEKEQYEKDVEKYNSEFLNISDKNLIIHSDFKREFELAALHIENIVISELKTSKNFNGLEFHSVYPEMEQYTLQLINGKLRPKPCLTNVMSKFPESYYCNKLDIYKENGINK